MLNKYVEKLNKIIENSLEDYSAAGNKIRKLLEELVEDLINQNKIISLFNIGNYRDADDQHLKVTGIWSTSDRNAPVLSKNTQAAAKYMWPQG